jgi:hypothetical protein
MAMSKTTVLMSALSLLAVAPVAAASTNLNAQNASRLKAKEQSIAIAKPAKAQAVIAAAPAPANTQIQMPPPEAMIIMIRSSLVALSQANVTNNYQVLNALGSNNFRQSNPPNRLAQLFAPFRTNNIDLAPVVFVTPQLSQQPKIENGRLRLIGFFPTQPMRVDYDLEFEPADGIWKLLGISVNLSSVSQKPALQALPQAAPQTQGR